MTINYFAVMNHFRDLVADNCDYTVFTGWNQTSVTWTETFSTLGAWSLDSEDFTNGTSGGFNPAVSSGRARLQVPTGIDGLSRITADNSTSASACKGWRGLVLTIEVVPTILNSAQTAFLTAQWSDVAGSHTYEFQVQVDAGVLSFFCSNGATSSTTNVGAYDSTAHHWWRVEEKNGQLLFSTSPDGTTWTLRVQTSHHFDSTFYWTTSQVVFTAENTAGSGAAVDVSVDNLTWAVAGGVVGIPTDLSGKAFLWNPTDADLSVAVGQSMAWPGGWFRSFYRVARDPSVATDDSGNTLGTQVYDHGWVLAERLDMYLEDKYETSPQWPMPSLLQVLPVTGTAAVNDGGKGWYGMTSVTWPGSGVGLGTLRQILCGDEGTLRKVGIIIDTLSGVTTTKQSLIKTTWANNNSTGNIDAAEAAIKTALAATSTTAQAAFNARYALAQRCALAALGFTPSTSLASSTLNRAVQSLMLAVTAKEAGLIGATFTSTLYARCTNPWTSNSVSLPSGY